MSGIGTGVPVGSGAVSVAEGSPSDLATVGWESDALVGCLVDGASVLVGGAEVGSNFSQASRKELKVMVPAPAAAAFRKSRLVSLSIIHLQPFSMVNLTWNQENFSLPGTFVTRFADFLLLGVFSFIFFPFDFTGAFPALGFLLTGTVVTSTLGVNISSNLA